MNRKEFLKFADKHLDQLSGNVRGALLYNERGGIECKEFVTAPIVSDKPDFWEWCAMHLEKTPICYYSNVNENAEWWGFESPKDAFTWSTRWL